MDLWNPLNVSLYHLVVCVIFWGSELFVWSEKKHKELRLEPLGLELFFFWYRNTLSPGANSSQHMYIYIYKYLQDSLQDDSSYIILKEKNTKNIIIIQHHEQKHIHRGFHTWIIQQHNFQVMSVHCLGNLGWKRCHLTIQARIDNTQSHGVVQPALVFGISIVFGIYKVEIQSAPNIGRVDWLWSIVRDSFPNVQWTLHCFTTWKYDANGDGRTTTT